MSHEGLMEDAKLNTAVIGCGGHARHHFDMIANEPRLHLAAVAEVDDERLKKATEEHKPDKAYADHRQMLDECDLQVIYVVTMPGHLVPIVTECLEGGLHDVDPWPNEGLIKSPSPTLHVWYTTYLIQDEARAMQSKSQFAVVL